MSKLYEYFGIDVKKGSLIFKEGEKGDFLYMIHEGKVEINKGSGASAKKIQILNEGEFVGEMAIIDSAPRSANAVALEDCKLIKMDRESFNNTVKENHMFALSVIHFLSHRLRETDEVLSALQEKR